MKLVVSEHAADRYVERVKPHLTRDEAIAEIERLAQLGGYADEVPEWVNGETEADLWFIPCDGIAIPCQRGATTLFASTTLTRSSYGEEMRAHKNLMRRKRRARAHKPERPLSIKRTRDKRGELDG